MTAEKEIKDAMKGGKLLIGSRSVMRGLKAGQLSGVVVASNCPDGTRNDVSHYAGIREIKMETFKEDSVRLGEICGKPFSVLILGIRK